MKNRILSLAVTVVLAAPIAAQATPITYDFTANGGAFGPLSNVTSSGSFTFDSSIIPLGGGLITGTGLLTGLSFQWNGVSYDQATANTGALEFDSSGVLNGVDFGTGCNAFGGCTVDSSASDWIVSGFTPVGTMTGADFLYTVGDGQAYDGFTTLSPAVAVPEPSTWLMFLFGGFAVLLGAGRSRKPSPTC
jgi:hypothetical protein